MIFRSGVFKSFSAAYSDVVFPEPVGPVTRMIPLGRWIRLLNFWKSSSEKPSCRRPDLDAVLVQDPHHHRLPMVGGDDTHPKVEFLLAHRDLDAAVLGPAPLGDVELGENLDAREDGAEEPSGGAVSLDQYAVDPVADANAVLERLDVDVRRPKLHGLGNHQVDEPDDRGAALVDLFLAGPRVFLGLGEIDRRVGELLEHRVGALAHRLAVVAIDRLQNALAGRQGDLDLAIENEPQLLENLEIRRGR